MVMISIVIAMTAWQECEDVKVALVRLWRCEMPMVSEQNIWRVVIFAVEIFRHFLLIPLMLATVPLFVLNDGGDALSQCLNTVAVLFILEIDDLAVASGLGKSIQSALEEVPAIVFERHEANLFVFFRVLAAGTRTGATRWRAMAGWVLTATACLVSQVLYMATTVIIVFIPLWLFQNGRLTNTYTNLICLETTTFTWFLLAATELIVVSLVGYRQGTILRRCAFAAAGVAVIAIAWLVVQSIIFAFFQLQYNIGGDDALGYDRNYFLEPLHKLREEGAYQNPRDAEWFDMY
jgi:hypothetical protein